MIGWPGPQNRFMRNDCRSIAEAIGDADGVVSALGYSGFNLGAHWERCLTSHVAIHGLPDAMLSDAAMRLLTPCARITKRG